jgi:integrase
MGTKADGTADRRHVKRKTEASRNKAVRELERKRDAGQVGKPGRVKTVTTSPATRACWWSRHA